jgi:cytochrome c-type biogenesis protein CcmH
VKYIFLILAFTFATPAFAVDADEPFLQNPQQEALARDIMRDLRCLVCRNESIVDSHAELARDLRILVRERVAAGDTPDQVRSYMVSRYGEWILLKPGFDGLNLMLWTMPLLFLSVGSVLVYRHARRLKSDDFPADDGDLSQR